jgi:hypothetical protein
VQEQTGALQINRCTQAAAASSSSSAAAGGNAAPPGPGPHATSNTATPIALRPIQRR